VDHKSYEVNVSRFNKYTIQVASSFDTLQISLKNIETYLQKLDIIRGYYAGIENKLLNLQMANLDLKTDIEKSENLVRGADLASSYGEFIMDRFKSEMASAVISHIYHIPQLVLRILK
jgi:flagellin-like hook-associated protein FlgL